DPTQLPPHVPDAGTPLLGPSRRARAEDLRTMFRTAAAGPDATGRDPHAVALERVWPLVDDPVRKCNRVHGPMRLEFSEETLNRHVLSVGPPGVGKTTQFVLPMTASLLADRRRTVVVFDPKGDQFGVLRDLAVRLGRPRASVLRLNLTDPGGSLGWNPLRAGMDKTMAQSIAASLVLAVENKVSIDSPFWRNNSIDILTGVILGLCHTADETLSLPRVCEVLDLPRPKLLEWLKVHEVAKFAAFLESGSHNAETCLADASMRLVAMLDQDLCAVLSHAELQLEHLFVRPQVLVVEMSETRIERLRPIFNVLVQQIFDRAIEAAERRPDARLRFPVSVVVDEFGSAIGAIPRFPVYLNTLRSRRVGVVAAVQSTSQIHSLYGTDAGAVLAGFSSKIFFPNVEAIDAELISAAAGTMTVRLPGDANHGGQWAARRVYLPEEVARPRRHPILGRPVTMLLADEIAVQAWLTPSFALPALAPVLQAHARRRRRPRRKQPLVYRPTVMQARPAPAFTDTRGLPALALHRLIGDAERKLGISAVEPEAQRAWLHWRREFFDGPAATLRFCEELLQRRATFAQLTSAARESRCGNPHTALKYLDFVLARAQNEREPKNPF
ncbi:MAG: type IV secretory system conjugative DNA transfer family protein, partial [Planctomycetes bacterium]|nr:type IV secretory system conjugative DNA transfer family protein [Planctomycetota bacterium]